MLVSVVPSNPKPRDRIAFKNANGTIAARYSYRPDIFFAIYTLLVIVQRFGKTLNNLLPGASCGSNKL
jgi:hypothetical protein